jgi:hypothetical protein
LPIIGIGGINKNNIKEVIMNGSNGIAMASSIIDTEDIFESTRDYSKIIENETISFIKERIFDLFVKLKKNKPLIHHITNNVVMNQTANATLNIGASPIMSHSKDDVEEVTKISNSLNLNIGTLDDDLIHSMILSGKVANNLNIPIVLDPVF